ncbi:MAG TPA: phosphoribosylformylglycinamidine synthase I [Anaerolineales bacterium]|jgi:phosphoribosylformylglycinamidine synthase
MKPQALVLQAHGTNRDLDVMDALTLAGADAVGVPLNELRAGKTLWTDFQLVVLPGGFSYADALGAGKLLAIDLRSYFADAIAAFVASGKPVIGICNGFQALVRAGILPGANVIASDRSERGNLPANRRLLRRNSAAPRNDMEVTLTFNAAGHFECRWVTLKAVSDTCLWTRGLDELITCPVAHGEGNFQTAHENGLTVLAANGQVALTYAHADGSPAGNSYPANPNGSVMDIAGLCNAAGNVLGLMPHPENHVHDYQHPRHTRGETGRSGLALFRNGVAYAEKL